MTKREQSHISGGRALSKHLGNAPNVEAKNSTESGYLNSSVTPVIVSGE